MYNIYRNTKHDNAERYAVYAEFTENEDAKKEPHSSLSRNQQSISHRQSPHAYNESERLAIHLGYKEVPDSHAYNGRYFIKNGKKWIHNIDALRKKLNTDYGRYIDDEELEVSSPKGFGYDVVAYYIYNAPKNPLLDSNEFKTLMKKSI